MERVIGFHNIKFPVPVSDKLIFQIYERIHLPELFGIFGITTAGYGSSNYIHLGIEGQFKRWLKYQIEDKT